MANKKITELPLAITASRYDGSTTVLPIVISGTTNQISIENLSNFVNAYNAHTGSAGNTFKGPQTIQSTLSVTGNASVGGNLVVAGTLTAQEYYSEITSASIIYSEGSTIFGNTADDTHRFTGSIILNGGETLGNAGLNAFSGSFSAQLARVQQATASLQTFTASQDSRNFTLSQVTASFAGEIGGLESYSASLKAAAIVSSSTQIQNYDVFALNSVLYIATGSMKGEIAGIELYTASLKTAAIVSSSTQVQNYDLFALNSVMYIATGSIKGEIAGIEDYTASLKSQAIVSSSNQIQNYDVFALNSNLYNGTGSIKGEIAGIEAYTASLKTAAIVSSSTQVQNYDLFALNSNLYTSTGSLIGITNGLMAFTAALDATYATDAQLYQLYAATASLNTTTGSLRDELAGIEAYTASLKGQAIVSSSTQVQNYDVFALNSNLYTSTGSIKGEIAGIEAYTSSLKAAISVSGTNVQIIGDLNVNKLNVQYISSSVLVTSGSNIFGDQSTDKHEFTGSVYLQNSLILGTEVLGNAGLNSVSSSLIGITNELMALTASMKSQSILSGSGLTNYVPMYNGTTALSSSIIFQSTGSIVGLGKAITIGSDRAMYKFAVNPIADTYFGIGYTDTDSIFMTAVSSSYDPKSIVYSAQSYKWYATSPLNAYTLAMVIQSSSLNVGFGGITNPLHRVDIDGSARVSNGLTVSGSLLVSGSSHTIQNGYVILQQVSQSLNFVDDTAAAAGGVPLGGLYRNGNFIVIRIV